MEYPDIEKTKQIVDVALKEDIGQGDVTTSALVPVDQQTSAVILAKESCRLAGLPVAELTFKNLDHGIIFTTLKNDCTDISPGPVAEIKGPAWSILTAERTALNFLQRLSGIATQTASFVEKVKQYGTEIYDTRKTTPTLRILERYAVRAGGGQNHRFDLSAQVLIKDNHLKIQDRFGPGSVVRSVQLARKHFPEHIIEVEIDDLQDVENALHAGADIILLDNMGPEKLKKAVSIVAGKAITEASGGVSLEMAESIAATGVNRISVGGLTHSFRSMDFSLEIKE
ncbi:MAG: carboxylating nicotinate-nucleotide diphosphorylase [Candidatus Theseobacter exili]|nr:carboxylating nicotinate-nucleotide diphosphorylase [Candidatus Theseobacter exili]